MEIERVLASVEARVEARVAVLEVLTCTALAEADLGLAKRLEERFREIAEHMITAPSDQSKAGAAGLALSMVLAKEIAGVENRERQQP